MKKLLVVLLSLGLIVAFSTAASAADVKFSGGYYLVGAYESNPLLTPDEAGYTHYSQAFFYTRTRLQPVFQIAEGLTFTVRMDALEKQWGNTNQKGNSTYMGSSTPDDTTSSRRAVNAVGPAGTTQQRQKIQESLEFERAYVTFMTGIGQFQIGYQNVDDWGTDFGDYSNSRPRIQYATKAGPMTLGLIYEKVYDNDSAIPANHTTDGDKDTYAAFGIYNGPGIEAGMLYKYYAYNSDMSSGVKTKMNLLSPYVKATFGPVYVEGEATYWFGKYKEMSEPYLAGHTDVDLQAWSAYVKGKVNFGPAYAGLLFGYSSGNDLTDDTKQTTCPSGGGPNFAPAFILMNDGYNTQNQGNSRATTDYTTGTANSITTNKYNMVVYNGFAGFNPTPKVNLEAAVTYATAAEKALSKTAGVVTDAVSDKLGTEIDVKATFKIYDNLTYMIGAGYLMTGDYFKGANPDAKIENDYVLLNQLTLSF